MVTKPTVGADKDAWGGILNSALDDLQAQANAKLPLTGGTLTGPVSSTSTAFGQYQPMNQGVLAWAYDPALITNSSAAVGGTVYLTKLHLSDTATATKLYWWVATVAVTPTAGQNEVGIYNSAGTKLASTNVDADTTSTGLKTTTITGQSLTAGQFYWVGMVFNAATPPGIARMAGLSGLGGAVNLGLTAATFRFAINGTAQTALPASITPSSNAAPAFGGPWAAVGV